MSGFPFGQSPFAAQSAFIHATPSSQPNNQRPTSSDRQQTQFQGHTRPFARGRGRGTFRGRGAHTNMSKVFNNAATPNASNAPAVAAPTSVFGGSSMTLQTSASHSSSFKLNPNVPAFVPSTFSSSMDQEDLMDLNHPLPSTKSLSRSNSSLTSEAQASKSIVIGEKQVSNDDRAQRFASKPQDNKYDQLKAKRPALRQAYIKQGKIADPENNQMLSDAVTFVGECQDMCPEFERFERELQMGLDPLEKIPGTDFVDHQKAVKRFRRSAAGDEEPLPCDVRPPHVLVRTLDYLFQDVLAEYGLEKSYSFVRDRCRAIRKDFFLQNYRGMEAVECHERIARYHILCSHVLCENPNVSLQQEHEQMRKTLQSLREYYTDLAKEGLYSPNEAEFQAYYILSHLFQNEFVSRAESLRLEVYDHPYVQLALECHALAQRSNDYSRGHPRVEGSLNAYTRLFRRVTDPSMPYLFACVLHMSFVSIRRGALKAMQKAFYCFPEHEGYTFSLPELVHILGVDDEADVLEHLEYYDIPYTQDMSGTVVSIGRIMDQNAKAKRRELIKEDHRASFPIKMSKRLIEVKRNGISEVAIVDGRVNTFKAAPVVPPTAAIVPKTIPKSSLLNGMSTSSTFTAAEPRPSTTSFAISATPTAFAVPHQTPSQNIAQAPTWNTTQFMPAVPQQPSLSSRLPDQPAPKSVVSKPEIPDDVLVPVIQDLVKQETMSLLTPIYQTVLESFHRARLLNQREAIKKRQEEAQKAKQEALVQMLDDASFLITQDIVSEVVNRFVYASLLSEWEVHALSGAYEGLRRVLVSEILREIADESLREARAERSNLTRKMRLAWCAWTKAVENRRALRMKLQAKARQMMDVSHALSGVPVRHAHMPSSSLHRVDIFGRKIGKVNRDEVPPSPCEWRTLDMDRMLMTDMLHSRQETTEVFYKIAISTCRPVDPSSVFYVDAFVDKWMMGLWVGHDRTDTLIRSDQQDTSVIATTRPKGTDLSMHVCVQFVNVSNCMLKCEPDENALSGVSGPDAAVCVFQVYRPELTFESYVLEQKQRVLVYLSQFPAGVRVPLLMVVPVTRLLSLEAIQSGLAETMQSLFAFEVVSDVRWIALDVADPIDLSFVFPVDRLLPRMEEALQWVISVRRQHDVLVRDLAQQWNDQVWSHMQYLMHVMPVDSPFDCMTGAVAFVQTWMRVYNAQLNMLQEIVFGVRCARVCWPAVEFEDDVGVGITWNSRERISLIHLSLEQCKLDIQVDGQDLDELLDGIWRSIVNMDVDEDQMRWLKRQLKMAAEDEGGMYSVLCKAVEKVCQVAMQVLCHRMHHESWICPLPLLHEAIAAYKQQSMNMLQSYLEQKPTESVATPRLKRKANEEQGSLKKRGGLRDVLAQAQKMLETTSHLL